MLIYVASPWRSNNSHEEQRNLVYAKDASRFVIDKGETPITPHLLYTRFLDDNDPEEREAGIACGTELLYRSDELWAFVNFGISDGMRREIEIAKTNKIPIKMLGVPNYGERA